MKLFWQVKHYQEKTVEKVYVISVVVRVWSRFIHESELLISGAWEFGFPETSRIIKDRCTILRSWEVLRGIWEPNGLISITGLLGRAESRSCNMCSFVDHQTIIQARP